MIGKTLVACYGSLKRGFHNHGALGVEADYKGNTTVQGVMYLHGSYPRLYHVEGTTCQYGVGVCRPDCKESFCLEKKREHVVEVYEISLEAAAGIDMMERGAGYRPEQIKTDWGEATIYFNPHDVFDPEFDVYIEEYTHESAYVGGL